MLEVLFYCKLDTVVQNTTYVFLPQHDSAVMGHTMKGDRYLTEGGGVGGIGVLQFRYRTLGAQGDTGDYRRGRGDGVFCSREL